MSNAVTFAPPTFLPRAKSAASLTELPALFANGRRMRPIGGGDSAPCVEHGAATDPGHARLLPLLSAAAISIVLWVGLIELAKTIL